MYRVQKALLFLLCLLVVALVVSAVAATGLGFAP
jgi:hypothetical protein